MRTDLWVCLLFWRFWRQVKSYNWETAISLQCESNLAFTHSECMWSGRWVRLSGLVQVARRKPVHGRFNKREQEKQTTFELLLGPEKVSGMLHWFCPGLVNTWKEGNKPREDAAWFHAVFVLQGATGAGIGDGGAGVLNSLPHIGLHHTPT